MTADLLSLAAEIAHAAIAVEHGPERYADQARDGNWPIYRVAKAAALRALAHTSRTAGGGDA